jgi:hypothetical protein
MFRSCLVLLCLCGACASDDDGGVDPVFTCADDGRAPEWIANYAADGTTVHVVLNSTPAPPLKGDSTWTIMVTDGNSAPLAGLTVDSTPFMPDHGHGTPLQETVTEGSQAGEYVLAPINLWMPGYWEVTIDFDDGAGLTDSVMYKACIDG